MASSRKVRLSPAAEDDVTDILQYTAETWGVDQAIQYRASLEAAFARLVDFPYSGMARDDLRPGYRSLQVERHIVYYRVEKAVIRVRRILHVRRDPLAALRGGSDDD